MSSVFAPFPSRPSFGALLAECDVLPVRVLCTGGVVWQSVGEGRWRAGHDGAVGVDAPTPARSPAAVDRWLRAHRVRPVALAVPDVGGPSGERLVLASAAGALGWRPPLELLAAEEVVAAAGPGLRRLALRARPLLDAAEQHALDAAERYARAAAVAARSARLFGAPALETVGAAPGLFVAVDALAGAGLRTLAAAEEVAARAFGRARGGAPATLRAALLEVRVAHAAPAVARRRSARGAAAGGAAGVWAVRVPVGGADAFDAAWALATGAWRALALAAYAAAGAWATD